jgi:alpha-beta hydrolase superfamily lysophospholipase
MVDGPAPLILPPTSQAAGAKLHPHRWLPAGDIRGAVLISHGYAEHGRRYAELAARFTAEGYAVYALDHWGHGLSDGQGGFVPHFSVFTDGLSALLAHIQAQHPSIPHFLMGHSMGGLIAANFLITHQNHFRAAALSGPALAPAKRPSALLRAISGILARVAPKLGVMKLDGNGVSRDAAVVAAYRADPLVYSGPIGARLAYEMLQAMERATQSAPRIKLPILIQHGGADRLTSPAASESYFQALGSSDKAIKIYDGLFHEIYNEPEKTAIIADLIAFFDRHIR